MPVCLFSIWILNCMKESKNQADLWFGSKLHSIYLKYRRKSEVCELTYLDLKSCPLLINELIGVSCAYDHIFTLRKLTFWYDSRARIIGALAVSLINPTGDANNKNTSHVGLARAENIKKKNIFSLFWIGWLKHEHLTGRFDRTSLPEVKESYTEKCYKGYIVSLT